jgi:hypothetical protein
LPPLASIFRKSNGASLVVRQRAPLLRALLAFIATLAVVFALYVVYELGRYHAGYDRQAASLERTGLEVRIEHLEKDNREMRTRLAEADTIRMGRAREQAEVARAMGDLQAQVARQSQELAFYRGVVAQNATAIGVGIEQLHITAGPKPQTFIVHLALVRAGRADNLATGTIQMSLEGTSDGGASKTMDLAALTAGRVRELRYNFRYLQNIEQELSLPLSLKPVQLAVEVQSSRHDVAPLSKTFLWTVDASP